MIKIEKNAKPNIDDIIDLYLAVGWGEDYSKIKGKYNRGLENSYIISAYKESKLIGFIRFLTDFNTTTYILEFIINPKYQKQGIGKLLIENILQDYSNTTIYTDCTDSSIDFYKKNGFKENSLKSIRYKV